MEIYAHSTTIIVGVYAIIFGLGKNQKEPKDGEVFTNTNVTATALLGSSRRQRSQPIDCD